MSSTGNRANTNKTKAQYPCPHANWGKVLATTFSLRRHIDLKHRKQKNHIWKYCGKRFSLLQYLKEHILIHTQETPFVCNINGCTQAFRQRAKLCAHRKTHRQEQNQKDSFVNRSHETKNYGIARPVLTNSSSLERLSLMDYYKDVYWFWNILSEHTPPSREEAPTLPSTLPVVNSQNEQKLNSPLKFDFSGYGSIIKLPRVNDLTENILR